MRRRDYETSQIAKDVRLQAQRAGAILKKSNESLRGQAVSQTSSPSAIGRKRYERDGRNEARVTHTVADVERFGTQYHKTQNLSRL